MGRACTAITAAAAVVMLLLLASAIASQRVWSGWHQFGPLVPLKVPLLLLRGQTGQDGRPSDPSLIYSVIDLLKPDAHTAALDDGSTNDLAADAAISTLSSQTKSTPSATAVALAYTCSYTVTIKTSCYSPRATRDAVALYFGDAYGNQVYAARLDDPSRGTFERCSTDTFLVTGPCGYKTCYLYLSRSGGDGWAPDWVRVVSPSTGQAVTFYYNGYALPANVWYGFNLCGGYSSSGGGGKAGAAGRASWMGVVLVASALLLVL